MEPNSFATAAARLGFREENPIRKVLVLCPPESTTSTVMFFCILATAASMVWFAVNSGYRFSFLITPFSRVGEVANWRMVLSRSATPEFTVDWTTLSDIFWGSTIITVSERYTSGVRNTATVVATNTAVAETIIHHFRRRTMSR